MEVEGIVGKRRKEVFKIIEFCIDYRFWILRIKVIKVEVCLVECLVYSFCYLLFIVGIIDIKYL